MDTSKLLAIGLSEHQAQAYALLGDDYSARAALQRAQDSGIDAGIIASIPVLRHIESKHSTSTSTMKPGT